MKSSYLSIVFFIVSQLFLSCTEREGEENLVDVAYFTPVYATSQELAARVTVDPPLPYQQSGKVITYGDYIFINKPNEGIHIVDNSNPEAPQNHSFIALKGNLDMAIVNDYLYADMYSSLVVLNVDDINNPVVMQDYTVDDVFYYNRYEMLPAYETVSNYAHVRYDNVDPTRGIVVDWEIEIRREKEENFIYDYVLFDVATAEEASNEAPVHEPTSTAGSMTRFLPIDNFLYTINFNELILFQLDAENKPNRWGKFDTATTAETLFRLNDLLFVGSVSGMLMYDVTDASNPFYINSIDHFRSCDPVVADTTHAYVTLRGGTNCFTENNELQIIDIQDPEALFVASRHIMFNPHGLAIVDNHLLVCDGTAGIKVVDVTDRTRPKVVNTYPIDFAYDVIVHYPVAIVVGEQTMHQYDISNLPEMVKISELQVAN